MHIFVLRSNSNKQGKFGRRLSTSVARRRSVKQIGPCRVGISLADCVLVGNVPVVRLFVNIKLSRVVRALLMRCRWIEFLGYLDHGAIGRRAAFLVRLECSGARMLLIRFHTRSLIGRV